MRQAKVDEARRKRKAGVERDGPSPKKQSDAPGTAPCTPEEEGVQVKAPEEEEEEQLAGQLLADLAVLSENPASMHKYLNKLSTSPAEEAKWAIFSEDLPGVHAGLLAPPPGGGEHEVPEGWKDLADRLLVWWVVEEEQAGWDSQEMLHQYLNSLSSSERVEDQAKFHLIAHNHLALYQDLESRGRWKAIATSKEDFTYLRGLVDRVKHNWSKPDDVWKYLKQEGDDPAQEGDLDLIKRNTPAFYVLIEEACNDGLWKDLKYMEKQWTLGGTGPKEVWGPHYGVCRHVGWDFSKLCGCGAPSSIRIRGEQSMIVQPWTRYITCHMNSRANQGSSGWVTGCGSFAEWSLDGRSKLARMFRSRNQPKQSNELRRLLLQRYIDRLPEKIADLGRKFADMEQKLDAKEKKLAELEEALPSEKLALSARREMAKNLEVAVALDRETLGRFQWWIDKFNNGLEQAQARLEAIAG